MVKQNEKNSFFRDYGQMVLTIIIIAVSVIMFVIDKPSRGEMEMKIKEGDEQTIKQMVDLKTELKTTREEISALRNELMKYFMDK